jgi:hypothetical protein
METGSLSRDRFEVVQLVRELPITAGYPRDHTASCGWVDSPRGKTSESATGDLNWFVASFV